MAFGLNVIKTKTKQSKWPIRPKTNITIKTHKLLNARENVRDHIMISFSFGI